MGWERALEHVFVDHDGNSINWQQSSAAISVTVKAVEHSRRRLAAEEANRGSGRWICLHCSHPTSMQERELAYVRFHLSLVHRVEAPRHGEDYAEAPGSSGYIHPSILVLSPELKNANLDKIFVGAQSYRIQRRVGFAQVLSPPA
ncbi:hypothetical protein BV20DRAFT_1049764 [Pilatotrama ljubarskyi]|nr:hypothetical protein BV20DRAFT_1049764 [Pilatotrama ljubarskyi]